jgi:hypothetical protein
MHLTCRDCGATIAAEDINIDRGLAKCRACNAVIDVEQAVRGAGGPATGKARPRVPQPPGITVEDLGGGLRLTRRWFVWAALFLTFFCVAWDSFLIFWYAMAVGMGGGGAFSWIAIIFPVAHVAAGVGLTYFTLALYLNRTVLEVNNGRLTVRSGPLPWPGNRDLDVSEVEQIFCQESTSRSRNGNVSFSYNVSAVLKGGRKETLLSSLPNQDQALFVEQLVEAYLGIEDRPVGGELPRS